LSGNIHQLGDPIYKDDYLLEDLGLNPAIKKGTAVFINKTDEILSPIEHKNQKLDVIYQTVIIYS